MPTALHLEEAQEILLNRVTPLPGKMVSLLQALDKISYNDIFAKHDLPAQAESAMDGYAVFARGGNSCTRFALKENLRPGELPSDTLFPGQASAVVTGGILPAGTNTVIPQELAKIVNGKVEFTKVLPPGFNIKPQGEDFKQGDIILKRGTRIQPGVISALSAYGISELMVFEAPHVAIISISPEIVPYDAELKPGQKKDSNGHLLAAHVLRDGGTITEISVAGTEEPAKINECLKKLMEQSDVVIITGGAASGICDNGYNILANIGAEILFREMLIKPGSHSGVALYKNKYLICLPGNPAACAVGYHLLASPVLRVLQGLAPYPQRIKAKCTSPFLKKSTGRRFIRAYAYCNEEGWQVSVLPGQKSSMLRALLNYNALIDVPAGHPPVEVGQEVSVLLNHSYELPKDKQINDDVDDVYEKIGANC
jgi:molybdopterin molybdotransferase